MLSTGYLRTKSQIRSPDRRWDRRWLKDTGTDPDGTYLPDYVQHSATVEEAYFMCYAITTTGGTL